MEMGCFTQLLLIGAIGGVFLLCSLLFGLTTCLPIPTASSAEICILSICINLRCRSPDPLVPLFQPNIHLTSTPNEPKEHNTMPFRARLKKTFSRSSRSSGSSSEASSTLSGSSGNKRASNVYQPGEKIPQKYRRPVDKAHKEKLEAFTFGDSWRRRSFQSVYSPMGSRMPSRRNSIELPMKRAGIGRRGASFVNQVDEGSGDDTDLTNGELLAFNFLSRNPSINPCAVGLSRQVSTDGPTSRGVQDFADPPMQHDSPFTHEDLALALKRSHLGVPSS
jgi:hypothetical protein